MNNNDISETLQIIRINLKASPMIFTIKKENIGKYTSLLFHDNNVILCYINIVIGSDHNRTVIKD